MLGMDFSHLNEFWMLLQQILYNLLWLSKTVESTRIVHESAQIQHESTRNILDLSVQKITLCPVNQVGSKYFGIGSKVYQPCVPQPACVRVNSKHAGVDSKSSTQPFLFNFYPNLIFLDSKVFQVFLNDFKVYHKGLLPTKIFLTKLQRY